MLLSLQLITLSPLCKVSRNQISFKSHLHMGIEAQVSIMSFVISQIHTLIAIGHRFHFANGIDQYTRRPDRLCFWRYVNKG